MLKKSLFSIAMLLLVTTVAVGLVGCGAKVDEKIVGTWVSAIDSSEITFEKGGKVSGGATSIVTGAKSFSTKDGVLTLDFGSKVTIDYDYKISDDGKTLTLTLYGVDLTYKLKA